MALDATIWSQTTLTDPRHWLPDIERAAVTLSCIAALLALGASPALGADSPDRSLPDRGETDDQCSTHLSPTTDLDARELTLQGIACFKDDQFAQAYTFYFRAYQKKQSDTLRAAMGRSLHELGLYTLAESYYQSFLDGADPEADSTRKIEKRLDQLADDIDGDAVRTKLRSFPSGATVHVQLDNGQWVEVGATPTDIRLREGEYRFGFRRDGHRRRRVTRTIADASTPATIDVDLYPTASGFDTTSRQWKKAGLITGLSAIPVLGAGAVFFGLSADQFGEAEDITRDGVYDPARENQLVASGHRWQRWGIGFTTVGAAAAVTAGVLYWRGATLAPSGTDDQSESKSGSSETTRALQLRPLVSPRSVGLHARF
jgi:hypothetical protein